MFRTIIILILIINSTLLEAVEKKETDITEKLKQSIERLGDKIKEKITGIKDLIIDSDKKNENDKSSKKNRVKIIKIKIHLPAPDAKIFQHSPKDIMLKRINLYNDDNYYIADEIWIHEKEGYTAGESMEIARIKVLDRGFSALVVEQKLENVPFTLKDAKYCIEKMYVSEEYFYENQYIGIYKVYINKKKFKELLDIKRFLLLKSGIDFNGEKINKILVQVKILDKLFWQRIEDKIYKSGLPYNIIAINQDEALINISNITNENILSVLNQNSLDVIDEKGRNILVEIEKLAS